MLHRTLSEHAAGCFYGDERLAERLWQVLLNPPQDNEFEGWRVLQDECYHLLIEGIDTRNPREYRLTDIRQLMGKLCNESLLISPVLPWLDELANKLLLRNGDLLYYRADRVQAYIRLAAELDPALLGAWRLSDWLQQSPPPLDHDIRRVIAAQSPFFAPPGNLSLPFAEGHVHFGGVTSESALLDEYLFSEQDLVLKGKPALWEREQHDTLAPLLTRARSLLSLFLFDDPMLQQNDEHSSYPIPSWQKKLKLLHDPMFDGRYLPDWKISSVLHANAISGEPNWILGMLAQTMSNGYQNRWLWLQLYLCRTYQSDDTHPLERTAILCFWQTVNAIRRRLIMDGQGLTRFAERYYAGPLGRKTKTYHDNIKRLFASPGDVAEIKSSPKAFSYQFATDFSSALSTITNRSLIKPSYIFGEHEITPSTESLAYLNILERWHFCGHFSRSSKSKNGKRPKADLKGNWEKAENLLRFLLQQSGWNQPEFLGGKLNPHFHFQPTRWFRGLDVAGDENALKIEGFAPMLRWLRSGLLTKQEGERESTGFHLSIHAGEDYAHPTSGMRHIDETVRFCEMRDGDRLGHALALGIEPTLWAERQGEMLLTLDEHLDNLVWLWHYATVLSGKLQLAQRVIPLLERRISRFYRRCSWCCVQSFNADVDSWSHSEMKHFTPLEGITPDILYRAWLLRRNCYYRWQQLHGDTTLTSKEKCALPDWARIADADNIAGQLYLQRHSSLLDSKEPPLVIIHTADEWQTQEYIGQTDRTILRPHHKNQRADILEDVETPAELEFMHALQDYLLDQYDSIGLIIETNPTSNVYIARLKKHHEHPIFRWNPPDERVLMPGAEANRHGLRRGPIRVLINTDDPGIMPTTLRTEFLLLREAAIELGISRTLAECWLETLRQYGMEQFHRNHLPVFEPK